MDVTPAEIDLLYSSLPDSHALLDTELTIKESNNLIFLGLKCSFSIKVPDNKFVTEIMVYGGGKPSICRIVALTHRVVIDRFAMIPDMRRCHHMVELARSLMTLPANIRNDVSMCGTPTI